MLSLLILLVIVLFLPISGYPQGSGHFDAGLAAQEREGFDAAIDAAIESFTLAIEAGDLSSQNLADAYNNRGFAYHTKGEKDRAIQNYNEAIRLNPNYANAYNNRGNAYADKGDNDRAIQDFNEAIRPNPNDAKGYAARGFAYVGKGDHDRAIQDFNEAIRLKPNYAEAYHNRGLAYAGNGDNNPAIQNYNEAIRLNPNYAEAYYSRGIAYGRKGDHDRAIQDFHDAIRLNPKNAGAYSSRGRSRFGLVQFQAAQEDFKTALELNATSPYYAIWLYLARTRAGQDGRTELAANVERLKFLGITEQIVSLFLEKTTPHDLFLAAKSPDPKKQKENLCEAQFYVGQHTLLRGNESEARKLFSTAVETCPTNFVEYSGAQAELKRLK